MVSRSGECLTTKANGFRFLFGDLHPRESKQSQRGERWPRMRRSYLVACYFDRLAKSEESEQSWSQVELDEPF